MDEETLLVKNRNTTVAPAPRTAGFFTGSLSGSLLVPDGSGSWLWGNGGLIGIVASTSLWLMPDGAGLWLWGNGDPIAVTDGATDPVAETVVIGSIANEVKPRSLTVEVP